MFDSRGGDSSDELSTAIRAAVSRRAATLESIRESTPVNDPAEVSALLKADVFSPGRDSVRSEGRQQPASPSHPLPQSPARNLLNTVSRSRVNEIVGAVKQQEENVMQNTAEMVSSLRSVSSPFLAGPLSQIISLAVSLKFAKYMVSDCRP